MKRTKTEGKGISRWQRHAIVWILFLAGPASFLGSAPAPFAPQEPAKVVSISGIWESNIGWKYDIKQKGSQFTWVVVNREHSASGMIAKNNKDLQVTWIDLGSKGTSKGTILQVNEQGKATFIEWDNGVFFHREI